MHLQPTLQSLAALAVMSSALGLTPLARAAETENRFAVELELGSVWQSRNDVEIPNDGTATRFSLEELAGSGPWAAGRVYFTWNVNDRHGLRFLAAPLSYSETGAFDTAVTFVDRTFEARVPTEARYRFDSWRVGYRYRFHDGERWRWWIGATLKIRDAEIRLSQAGVGAARDTDVGFVPLAHVSGQFRFADRWRLLLDLDALAGGPGRAEDLSLKLGYDVDERWTLTFGYRTVEGGADVDEVYNFAWFHYATLSAQYRW